MLSVPANAALVVAEFAIHLTVDVNVTMMVYQSKGCFGNRLWSTKGYTKLDSNEVSSVANSICSPLAAAKNSELLRQHKFDLKKLCNIGKKVEVLQHLAWKLREKYAGKVI